MDEFPAGYSWRVALSRARVRFTSRRHSATASASMSTQLHRTVFCACSGCLSPGVHRNLLLSFSLVSLADGQIAYLTTPDGTSCAATALPNANQLALLRWYGANVTASFSVGGGLGLAFDGSNPWSVNPGTSSVSKLRASDGALLGTFTVGYIPGYAAFDGANIWVTNLGDNTVSKLRASDGATLGTFPTGVFPWGIAFDGTSSWVGNILDSTASKFRPSDGALLG